MPIPTPTPTPMLKLSEDLAVMLGTWLKVEDGRRGPAGQGAVWEEVADLLHSAGFLVLVGAADEEGMVSTSLELLVDVTARVV